MKTTPEQPKPWHLHTHEEKLTKFSATCRWCGRRYVDHTKLWVHEQFNCLKRTAE